MKKERECILMQAPKVSLSGLLEQLKERYSVIQMRDNIINHVDEAARGKIQALVSCKRLPREVLELLPNLGIIANNGAGVDNIDLDYCQARGIHVTNTPNISTDDVADMALLLMLAALRHLRLADRYVRDGLWPTTHSHFPLAKKKANGLRVGIVGMGRIGQAIAKRVECFNNIVAYYGRREKVDVPYTYYPKLLDLAKNSDVLIVACALCKETKHMVGKEILDALGAEGTLINVARGAIVDEEELVNALAEKRLGAAGLDTFENEPFVPSKLLHLDNVVLTPHVASATLATRKAMDKLILDNLDAYFLGKPLITPVI